LLGACAFALTVLSLGSVHAQAPGLYYIHVDHLNTPRAIYNQQQQLVWRWDQQEPFGNSSPDENPAGLGTFECNLRFAGQYYDNETNLAYNYFRDFDPSLGRYVESDPIGLQGGLNTYLYVVGNPVKFVDPRALDPICFTPTTVCDGNGGIEICLGPAKGKCDEKCSRAHEEQHAQDMQRERPDICRNRPRGARIQFIMTIASERDFVRKSECRAYRVGLDCRQDLLRRACFTPACDKQIRDGITRDTDGMSENCN